MQHRILGRSSLHRCFQCVSAPVRTLNWLRSRAPNCQRIGENLTMIISTLKRVAPGGDCTIGRFVAGSAATGHSSIASNGRRSKASRSFAMCSPTTETMIAGCRSALDVERSGKKTTDAQSWKFPPRSHQRRNNLAGPLVCEDTHHDLDSAPVKSLQPSPPQSILTDDPHGFFHLLDWAQRCNSSAGQCSKGGKSW